MFDNMKFYDKTRLVRKDTSALEAERGHQQYTKALLTGRITGKFMNLQPLHVGTGLLVPPENVGIESDVPLLKSFHQIDGRLTVPGSSLKGPVRSLVEAITYSCVSKTRTRLDKDDYAECRYASQRHHGELCPACKMFGAMGYQGQIAFSDAPMVTGGSAVHFIPPQYQPKSDWDRRHYPHDLQDDRDPTWPLEVAAEESQFSLHISYQNLSSAELGLLLMALGQGDPAICLKIGAGKSSGLGAIRFMEIQVEALNTDNLYLTYESKASWQPVNVADCLARTSELLRKDDALNKLQADLGCDHF